MPSSLQWRLYSTNGVPSDVGRAAPLHEVDRLWWVEQKIDDEPWTPCIPSPLPYAEAQSEMDRIVADLMGPTILGSTTDEGEA